MKKKRGRLLFLGLLGLVALAIIVYCNVALDFVKVPTTAMANTILAGDRLVINRFFRGVNRGDLVMFKYPGDQKVHYVKRVVGLPGETIHIVGHIVYIDGKELPEQRVQVWDNANDDPLKEGPSEGEGSYRVFVQPDIEAADVLMRQSIYGFAVTDPFVIPDRQYFLMGDQRDNSQDSRVFGAVDGSLIVGKVVMVYWSESTSEGSDQGIRWKRIFSRPR
jgi:signal peptidase I